MHTFTYTVDKDSEDLDDTHNQVLPEASQRVIDSPKSRGPSCLSYLSSREICEDPYLSLTSFKSSFYSLKSHVQRLELERQLKEHEGCVNCINFSHGGELLASGSDDLHVVLWDWAKGRKLTKFDSGHIANVFQVSVQYNIV